MVDEAQIAESISLANDACEKLINQIEPCALCFETVDYTDMVNAMNFVPQEFNDISHRILSYNAQKTDSEVIETSEEETEDPTESL